MFIISAIAKPVIGVVDLATGVSEGIKSTTAVFDDDLDRQRLPRYIGKDKILKPYDLREALGQSWLHELGNAKFSSEVYLCHLELRIEDLAAILTETRVLMIHINKLTLEYNAPFRGMNFRVEIVLTRNRYS
jgi:vacuolar protein sorting-associated protein 13A/C